MNRFMGEIEPVYGRWYWPIERMEIGDHFIVDQARRNPEKLRAMMSVRAAQLKIRLSVAKRPALYPGYTMVTRVAWPLEEIMD